MKGYCTLRELQEYYSLDDLSDMNEAIEYDAACQELAVNKDPDTSSSMVMIDGSKF